LSGFECELCGQKGSCTGTYLSECTSVVVSPTKWQRVVTYCIFEEVLSLKWISLTVGHIYKLIFNNSGYHSLGNLCC